MKMLKIKHRNLWHRAPVSPNRWTEFTLFSAYLARFSSGLWRGTLKVNLFNLEITVMWAAR
jgi:hypothetical protein